MTYLKGYMKAVKTHLQETKPDRVPAFEKGAAAFAKKCVPLHFVDSRVSYSPSFARRVLGSFNDWQFFTGESMNPDGMVGASRFRPFYCCCGSGSRHHALTALMNYREDGVTPYMVFVRSRLLLTPLWRSADCSPLTQWKDGLKEVKL
jgi:hypothetical protein